MMYVLSLFLIKMIDGDNNNEGCGYNPQWNKSDRLIKRTNYNIGPNSPQDEVRRLCFYNRLRQAVQNSENFSRIVDLNYGRRPPPNAVLLMGKL